MRRIGDGPEESYDFRSAEQIASLQEESLMPSPFPGMDPYLEHPDFFPGLHDDLISQMKEQLHQRLPEGYYATSKSRVWIEVSQRYIEPDVEMLRHREGGPLKQKANGPAVLAAPIGRGRPILVRVPHDERRESFLEIYALQDNGDRLVTTIEILSPSNKTPGEHGRELYLRKQKEILDSRVHLVEIDLLLGGIHSTGVPRERVVEQSGPFDYHICIHRFDHFEDYLVYPVRLEERLPEIAIPLLPEGSPVLLDLQTVFDRAYDIGAYRRRVRYNEETPIPPLSGEQAEWATRVLRERGVVE
jgi:hypothetical protein